GVDGLLHISKLGQGQRIRHPQDVVKVGQSLQVVIEKIDQQERRISLALVGQEEELGETSYSDVAATTSSGFGSLGDLLKANQQKKERKGKKRK
ncbi:MAG: S1 RNA-binding domain-containing protein, partial [Desulfuromonadales bacterium]|nr:S1 RNA-binding domain-containing protein [Desulfuromonadales bacterium]